MRRASPVSTEPGPTSMSVSAPSCTRPRTQSTQRTAAVSWRVRRSRSVCASDAGAPSTLQTTGTRGSRSGTVCNSPLNAAAAAKVAVALARLEQGNLSNAKGVGEGVLEYRINFGPGYRVYFGRDGEVVVILLTGGTKKRQQRDIDAATAMWADYRRRKRPR